MLHKPKLKSFLTVYRLADLTWGVRGGSDELWRLKFNDQQAFATFSTLLPYLTGDYAVPDIIAFMAAKGIEAKTIEQLLTQMEQNALLEEADGHGLSPDEVETFKTQIAFFSRLGTEGGERGQARLRAARVAVIGDGRLGQSICRQLRNSGIGEIVVLSANPDATGAALDDLGPLHVRTLDRTTIWPDAGPSDDQRPALLIVAQEAEDPELFDAIDACSKRLNLSWLLVRALESHVGWVGPLFIPEQTADYRSLDARLRGNLSFYGEHSAFEQHLRSAHTASAPVGGLHAFLDLLAATAVVESIKVLCDMGGVPHLAGRFITINLSNWDVESHDVLRVPRVGLEAAEPHLFAWKDMPHEDIEGHREGIFARRS